MCNECNEFMVYYVLHSPLLPLKELLVKHIKQALMSCSILKGNDEKTTQTGKSKQFDRKDKDRILNSFSAFQFMGL